MITQTSKLAYKQINREGVAGNQKNIIMETIKSYCNMEHYDGKGISLQEIKTITGIEINAVSGRVNDLKKDDLLVTTDKRKCSITKRLVSPVIPKCEESKFVQSIPLQNKILLLMGMYGYDKDQVIFNESNDFQEAENIVFTIRYKYWKMIDINHCKQIEENANCLIIPCHWEDSDTGDNFLYEVKYKEI